MIYVSVIKKLLAGAFLLADGVRDFKRKEINVVLCIVSTVCAACFRTAFENESILLVIIGMLPGLALLGLAFLSQEKIGKGDGIETMALGSWIGVFDCVKVLFISFLFLTFFACLYWGVKRRNAEIPFVPFLFIGYVTGVLI